MHDRKSGNKNHRWRRCAAPLLWLRCLVSILLHTAAILSLLLLFACRAFEHRSWRTLDRFFATDPWQTLWCADLSNRTLTVTRTHRWPSPELFWWFTTDRDPKLLPVGPVVRDPPTPELDWRNWRTLPMPALLGPYGMPTSKHLRRLPGDIYVSTNPCVTRTRRDGSAAWAVRTDDIFWSYGLSPPMTQHYLTLPLWIPKATFAILPTLAVLYYLSAALGYLRARRRLATRHCPTCNYDLRASPDRCPECGYTPAHPARDAACQSVSTVTPGPSKAASQSGARP